MPQLTLVVPDLYPSRQSSAAQAELPRLPTLERWLAQSRRTELAADWRRWLLGHCVPAWSGAGLGAVAACAAATAATPAASHWLATPVHFVAGLDTIRLHPQGLLRLAHAEQEELVADFARVFSDSGWQLLAGGARELLLAHEGPTVGTLAEPGSDPARWLGSDPAAGLAGGQGSAPLRRLGAEIEMWLHEHAVNRRREARGELPVSALWIWGGGPAPGAHGALAARTPTVQLHAGDLFVRGLAALLGQPPPSLPTTLPELLAAQAARGPVASSAELVVVPGTGIVPGVEWLQDLERDWLQPAWAGWRAGQWQGLALVCGTQAFAVRRSGVAGLWRALRAPPPWWQVLLAC